MGAEILYVAGIQCKFYFCCKLFKVMCICKTCLSSILTTQILPRDWRELFWIIALVVKKIRKTSRSYLQNLSLVCLKWSIMETVTDIAKSSRRSLEKAIEITLLPRLKWNLTWEDLNRTRKIEQFFASCSQYIFSWLCAQRHASIRPVSRNLNVRFV